MRSPAALLLKERTAHVHARVDAGLDLLAPDLTPSRLAAVTGRLLGFWAGTEPAVDAWAANDPARAARLQWRRRRRSPLLRGDLERQRGAGRRAAVPVAPPVFSHPLNDADAFGWLYVVEGSTLGGAVIDRALRARGCLVPAAFTPYPEGPGPMWRSLCDELEGWVAGDAGGAARAEAAATAALRTFTALADWLAPVLVDHPADAIEATA